MSSLCFLLSSRKYFPCCDVTTNDVEFHESQIISTQKKSFLLIRLFIHVIFFLTKYNFIFISAKYSFFLHLLMIIFLELWIILLISKRKLQRKYLKDTNIKVFCRTWKSDTYKNALKKKIFNSLLSFYVPKYYAAAIQLIFN